MSRRLLFGLQPLLRRVPAEQPFASLKQSCEQSVAARQCKATPFYRRLEGTSFAASACCTQVAFASASSSPTRAAKDQPASTEQYSYIGRITEPYIVKPKPVFAVVEIGPTQFKVTPDDLVYSEKLRNVDVGDKLTLNKVLLLGNTATTVIGRPCVPGASVTAIVEEQFLNGKVLIFKKRRRKNSRRLNGHRQELTSLRITEVHGLDAATQSAKPGIANPP